MRRLTVLKDAGQAEIVGELLEADQIAHTLEHADGDGWEIWVHRDDERERARKIVDDWESDPDPARFADKRAAVRKARASAGRDVAKRQVVERARARASEPVRVGLASLALLAASVVCTWLGIGGVEFIGDAIFGLPNGDAVSYLFIDELMVISDGRSAFIPFLYKVREGELWRLFTPPFVHTGGLFHLGMNAWLLVLLGSQVETRKGVVYMIILALLTGVVSSLAQYSVGWYLTDLQEILLHGRSDYGLFGRIYLGGPLGGGLSGVVYGLFGYIVVKSRVDPLSGLSLHASTQAFLIIWLLACFAGRPITDPASGAVFTQGIAGNIANMAHLFGLLSGGLWALVSHRIHRSW